MTRFLPAAARAGRTPRKEKSRRGATTEPTGKRMLPCRPGLTRLWDVSRAGDELVGGSAGGEGIDRLVE